MGPKNGPWSKFSPTWLGPIEGVQDHQDPGLPKVAGEALGDGFVFKGALNPHLRGFEGGINELWPHFLEKPCCRTGLPSSNVRRYLWSRKDGPFGKEFPVSGEPTPDRTSGFSQLTGSRQRDVARWTNFGGPIPVGFRPIYSSSEVPISNINTEGVVKRIRRIADSPTDLDAEGSDELDGEEVEVVPHLVGHPSRNSSDQPLANRFQSQVIPSTPRTFQPVLAFIPTTIPPSPPSNSHARPALNPEVRPSPS
ncbi:hypothetical protein O181_081834 [Austropuccinia psidii MF-1]|uniref:Uncharacterized protein n=1 Tax=Austropuccinia psidii MF-1 TaxID=1389203 RepID=A0A9Q3FNJ8_9BASI|nr:hypothetical protein [Austropuccinia psidii MF-1]